MKKALIIGGASGIGLSVAIQLAEKGVQVTVADKKRPLEDLAYKINYLYVDLLLTDFRWLDEYSDIDYLFYSAGFGRVAPFESLLPKEIENLFRVNTMGVFRVLNHYMPLLKSQEPFYCGAMVSIAGRIASPLFSVYSASKAALFRGIEAINIELEESGTNNRILEVSPGSIKGTSFNGGTSDGALTRQLGLSIINSMEEHKTLLIPELETIFKNVITRYNDNPHQFASESYKYKYESNRINLKPQLTVGYLSGTFDLFHIGHLNLIKKAREHCDYLVVGVHKDASHKGKNTVIPFEERKSIVESVKYVDKVIESEKEDWDVYRKDIIKFDKLFVGSDYKGSERFNKYEKYFADKNVEIIYFPYTQGRSSTQLREQLSEKK